MEKVNNTTVDEMGRIKIPQMALRAEKWPKGAEFTLTRISKIAFLHLEPENTGHETEQTQLDELGRFKISLDMRKALQWEIKDELFVYHLNGCIVMGKKDATLLD